MGEDQPYTDKDRRKAILWSALLGWAGVTAMELIGAPVGQLLFFLPFFAIIGLPIAFLLTSLIGGPVVRRIMRHQVSWPGAAAAGAFVATIIAALSVVLGRLNGLRAYIDQSFHFQIGGGEYVREVDGILTAYGWYMLGIRTIVFIALGASVGMVVRFVIGPGNRRKGS